MFQALSRNTGTTNTSSTSSDAARNGHGLRITSSAQRIQNVERAEPGYRDVAARIQRLGGTISSPIRKVAAKKAAQPAPVAAPGAAAASAPPAPVASARAPSAPATGNEPAKVPPPETAQPASQTDASEAPIANQRRNRKIGFV